MITIQEALEIIEYNAIDLGHELIPLQESGSRILAEDLHSDRPLPPYDRVTMDGIAINYNGFKETAGSLEVTGIAPAGAPQATLDSPKACLEVMTGAVLPKGADTIIRYEDVNIRDGLAHVLIDTVVKGMNVHTQGSDIEENALLLKTGSRIRPQEIGIAASIGKHRIQVKKNPKTIILSTGDELVDIHQTPESHQIRRSNSYTNTRLVAQWGIKADQLHLPDDEGIILEKLEYILVHYDLVILTGGVSKGKFDFIPKALKELGVQQLFHKVRQRPGKPIWFGRKDNTIVFGLPGNPVSSFVCARKYIFHWLHKSQQTQASSNMYARLASDVTFKPDLHCFLPVSVSTNEEGILQAEVFPGNGSGDFANLKNANAFIELPRGKDLFLAGEIYPILAV